MAAAAKQKVVDLQQMVAQARQRQEAAVEDLIEQIQNVREEITTRVARLHTLSMELRAKSRRNLDEGSSQYIVYANAHLRLAGALGQGLRRTGSTDRVLDAGRADREEARRRDEVDRQWRESRDQKRALAGLDTSLGDAFDDLYSEIVDSEEVSDA